MDLRPISLCFVSYKIVSKVLCSRLKRFLPGIVSETHWTFVFGRLISNNILISHEVAHDLGTNSTCNEDFMAIKTDMSKAYDRIECDFWRNFSVVWVLTKKWVDWAMFWVRYISYSVLLNGNSHSFIKSNRGLSQRDPLSPFHFILCTEA